MRLLCLVVVCFAMGCSWDIVPVNKDRVRFVQFAEKPVLRGKGAPGWFKHQWGFSQPKGYLFDPTEIEFVDNVARLKPGLKHGVLVTNVGAPYVALDVFQEEAAPNQQGKFVYQLSPNLSNWYYFNGKNWVVAGPNPSLANTATEVTQNIQRFHLDAGLGSVGVKIFFIAPNGPSAKETVALKTVGIEGILPAQDDAN